MSASWVGQEVDRRALGNAQQTWVEVESGKLGIELIQPCRLRAKSGYRIPTMRTTKGGPPCDGLPLRRAGIAVARRGRARGLAGHIQQHVKLPPPWGMARTELRPGGLHSFSRG